MLAFTKDAPARTLLGRGTPRGLFDIVKLQEI